MSGALRLRIRCAQVKRLRRGLLFIGGGAKPGHPVNIRCAPFVDERRLIWLGPFTHDHACAGSDESRGCGHRRMRGFAQWHDTRRDQSTAARSEKLQIDVMMPCIDCGSDRRGVVGRNLGCRQSGERGDADDRP